MSEAQVTTFTRYLTECAPRYFPDFAGDAVEVTPMAVVKRPASTLYHFLMHNATAQYPVLVKVRQPPAGGKPTHRPKIAVVDPDQQYWLEYRALAAIQDHFSQVNDPRFGTIRMLDALPDQRAIVMIKSEDPDLRKFFARRNRFLLPLQSDKLYTVFSNVGAWLRTYHALPVEEHVLPRHTTRADYEHAVENMLQFLVEHLGHKAYFDRVASAITTRANDMPDDLPLGRGHGDFSLRNILVDANHKVTIIDTLARWQAPIYEDIGYFLVRLYTNQLQVYSQGIAFSARWLARCEREFLTAYFSSTPIPQTTVDLFKVQALLDQWTALVEMTTYRQSGKIKIKGFMRRQFTNREFKKIISNLLDVKGE